VRYWRSTTGEGVVIIGWFNGTIAVLYGFKNFPGHCAARVFQATEREQAKKWERELPDDEWLTPWKDEKK
jgi:hypothetical protein